MYLYSGMLGLRLLFQQSLSFLYGHNILYITIPEENSLYHTRYSYSEGEGKDSLSSPTLLANSAYRLSNIKEIDRATVLTLTQEIFGIPISVESAYFVKLIRRNRFSAVGI